MSLRSPHELGPPKGSPDLWPTLIRVALIGVATELIYALGFVWPFPLLGHYRTDTDMAGIMGHHAAGFALFIGCFAVLFGLMFLAVSAAGGHAYSAKPERELLRATLLGSLIFGVTLIFVYPVTAIDLYAYVAQSRVLLVHHGNPIFVTPSAFPTDHTMFLAGGWTHLGTPYGPLGILIDAIPTLVASGSLLLNLVLLKTVFALLLVAEAWMVYRLVKRVKPNLALTAAICIGWNPLLLFEFVANGHNDVAMLVLATLGLTALIEGRNSVGLLLIAASILVKYATAPLLPLGLIFVLTRSGSMSRKARDAVIGLSLSAALAILLYAPFWQGPATLKRSLMENNFHLQSFGAALSWLLPSLGVTNATLIGQALFIPVYIYACFLASRGPDALLRGAFIATVGFVGLFAANVKIWYLSWPAVLAALTSRLAIYVVGVMALGASISAAMYAYVYLWLGGTSQDFGAVNAAAYLMSMLPAVCLLAPTLRSWFARVRDTAAGCNAASAPL